MMNEECAFPTFAQAFEDQARVRPQALAIAFGTVRLTYDELNRGANRIAHYLLTNGVTRASRIGIAMPRGEHAVETTTMLLAVLKIAAYVPLDPSAPQRLVSLVMDADIHYVLTHRSFAAPLAVLSEEQHVTILCLDELESELEHASANNPHHAAVPEDVAYLLYTTGTATGKPKGVVVGHRSLAHFVRAHTQAIGVQASDRASGFFGLWFDASLADLAILTTGAALYPVPANALTGTSLGAFFEQQAITLATLTPSTWRTIPPEQQALPALRLLVFGGEICSASLVQSAKAPWRRVFNEYGLTETTVAISMAQCHDGGNPPGIGQPFSGICVTIRDERLALVPDGTIGQLCVAGSCLALGYTDEQLTRERFVLDPGTNDRLFLTKDLGWKDASGELYFLGRQDPSRRYKDAGGRLLELDAIEAVLLKNQAVQECAVEHSHGRIVGYVALAQKGNRGQWSHELDRFMKEHMPWYMCPRAYVLLPELPRNANDKLDRHALRSQPVHWTALSASQDPMIARTPAQAMLAHRVADILNGHNSLMASLDPDADNWQPVDEQTIDIALPASALGIDSLLFTEFAMAVVEHFGVLLDLKEKDTPLYLLATAIEHHREAAHA